MIPTYNSYVEEINSLTFSDFQQIHTDMIEDIGSDEDARSLYNELIRMSVKYAGIRAKWPLLSRQEKMDQDAGRSTCHDALIVKLNKLARHVVEMNGKEAKWRAALGDGHADTDNRRRIGDLACYLAFINSLYAR